MHDNLVGRECMGVRVGVQDQCMYIYMKIPGYMHAGTSSLYFSQTNPIRPIESTCIAKLKMYV